ncbi:uncharacterized protein BO87DRAFT_7285 [Aspergillus neoniger CBS 115656]|uniref:Uncharacterized protein n=1 Tax=Aspergillus neoniger (strain CBS 115656) TaxID=1448310 RepID=A0A318Z0M9_ASPNB|nr:hypothetical protein BO87DRAFT_7285 [Aspergillus neoniger CBS 115656]PYH39827.1 hypothetical protein BO87DRAFT_7285 [Aspergillus neoniger CBS 115656]
MRMLAAASSKLLDRAFIRASSFVQEPQLSSTSCSLPVILLFPRFNNHFCFLPVQLPLPFASPLFLSCPILSHFPYLLHL